MQELVEKLDWICNHMLGCDVCPICRNEESLAITDRYGGDCDFSSMTETELKRLVDIFTDALRDDSEDDTEDMVNKAPHYNKGGIECIKAIEASMTPEEYRGFLKGQVIKYVWRYLDKGEPVKDLKKARYYVDDLIRVMEAVNHD